MKLKHGYIQNPESIPVEHSGTGWVYFSEDDKSIYLNTGNGPVKFSGSEVDLSKYYTIDEVDNAIENKVSDLEIPSLDEYAKLEDIPVVPSLDGYAKLTDIPSLDGYLKADEIGDISLEGYAKLDDLNGYATEDYVAEQIKNVSGSGSEGSSATDKPITVTGVSVGNLSNGFVIPEGSTLTDVLELLLCKTIGVKSVSPSVVLTGESLGSTYEVGTTVNLQLGYVFTDGKFVGETGYSYSVNANCAVKEAVYSKNGAVLGSSSDSLVVPEGDTKYMVSVKYDGSTVVPVNNMGEDVNVSIAAGTATSTKSVKGLYKYFVGYSAKTSYDQFTSDDVRALNASTGYLSGNKSVAESAMTSNGTSIVIACPSKYTLKSIQNGVGASILANFKSGEVAVRTGDIDTMYTVYVYPITNGAQVEFKNIIFE